MRPSPVLLGGAATLLNQVLGGHEADYRETISVWFGRSSTYPQAHLMVDVPLSFKLHRRWLLLFCVWPFTRLVHAVSAPVGYVARPRWSTVRAARRRSQRRAWRHVGLIDGRARRSLAPELWRGDRQGGGGGRLAPASIRVPAFSPAMNRAMGPCDRLLSRARTCL